MLVSTGDILRAANGYAIGGFNVYNLEGVKSVIEGAEQLESCVVLQVHAGALEAAGIPLIDLCLSYAQCADVPVSVHLDCTSDPALIRASIAAGMSSVMADGSHLTYAENAAFVSEMATLAHRVDIQVEATLGRMTGLEDAPTIDEPKVRLTDPAQAARFVSQTDADMLAVSIGNVHGPNYSPPTLDFKRLEQIKELVSVPLVLHGASGLDSSLITKAIAHGIRKFNVNTELRRAYIKALRSVSDDADIDLVPLMNRAGDAMREVVMQKIQLFGSADSAKSW